MPRLPGHGTTVAEANLTHWEDWYAEVERNLALLRERCDDVFVMGLSMGGTLSIRLAEEHGDEIAGLVLVNPSLLTKRPDRFLLPVLRWVKPTWPGIASDIKKDGAAELAYDQHPGQGGLPLSRLWLTTRADLDKVTQPLLVCARPRTTSSSRTAPGCCWRRSPRPTSARCCSRTATTWRPSTTTRR